MFKKIRQLSFLFMFAVLFCTMTMQVNAAGSARMYCSKYGGHVYGVPKRKDGKPWYHFSVAGGGANKGSEAFCRDPQLHAASGQTVTVTKSTGYTWARKALTWYFLGGSRTTARRHACQSYIWAGGKKANMATGTEWAWDDIAKTQASGYVLIYTPHLSAQQGWFGYQAVEKPTTKHVEKEKKDKLSLDFDLQIDKIDASTGAHIDTGCFEVKFDGKALKEIKKTKNGIYTKRLTIKVPVVGKSKKVYYVTNWNVLSAAKKKEELKKGHYPNKAAAKKAAQSQAEKNFNNNKKKARNSKHTWTVTETNAPAGHFLADQKTKTVKTSANDKKVSFKFVDPQATAEISVTKTSKNERFSGLSLEGAVFGLYANDKILTSDTTYLKLNKTVVGQNTLIETGKTGKDGKLKFKTKLYPGKYYIKELVAPKGFVKYPKKLTFTLSQHQKEVKKKLDSTINIPEDEISGRIAVEKTKGYGKNAEKGITFDIITQQNIKIKENDKETTYKSGSVVEKITTDANGKAISKYYPFGSYLVKQENTEGDSVKVPDWTVTISSGNKVTYSYAKNNVQLKIKKYVKEKGEKETPEANAVFTVLDTSKITKKDLEKLTTQKARQEYVAGSKAVLGTITTDANGEGTYIVTNGNKELTYDKTYTLLQTAGDSRYSLADATDVIINSTLSEREYAFSFVDTNACVLLKYKLDARTGEKTPEKGAEFEITQVSSDNKDEAAEATTATDAPEEGTTAGASGETKGDTGETQPAFPMTVTTNEAGIVDLSILPAGTYNIHQTGGDEDYSYTDDITIRVDSDGKVYEGDSEIATVSITRTDYSKGNGLSIKKNLVENPDKPDEKAAESGAIFTVIDAKDIEKSDLMKLVTLNLRKEYVSSLEESQILGTVTTDESGNGYLPLDENVGEFIVLQTEGQDGYSIADPVFSSDDAMKEETIKHGEQVNKMYSFTADDIKESRAKVSVMKQKKDDNADAVAEQDATFQVLDVATLMKAKGLTTVKALKEELAKLKTLSSYQQFVSGLPQNAIIGTLNTDAKGQDSVVLQMHTNAGEAAKDNGNAEPEVEAPVDSDDEIETGEVNDDSDGSYEGNDTEKEPEDEKKDTVGEQGEENDDSNDDVTYWTAAAHKDGFVVIQTGGDVSYKALAPAWSGDMESTAGTDDTGAPETKYAFSGVDEKIHRRIKVTKKKRTGVVDGKEVTMPEGAAEFALYDASDLGEDAKPVCTLVTGTDGTATSPDLPIGSYILKQTKGADGFKFIDDQTINITEDTQETVEYEYLNEESWVNLKVTKVSEETNHPLGQALFELYKLSDVNTETGEPKAGAQVVRSLYTNNDGYASCQLPFGEYYLIEKTAPLGFLNKGKGVKVILNDEKAKADKDGNRSATLTYPDTPIYGEIKGEKQGEYLTGKDTDGNFLYEKRGIEGAKYTLYAREDITDDAGNLIWAANQEISTATSGKNGAFQFTHDRKVATMSSDKEFWLGKYYFKETEAPYGFTLDTKEYDVTLTWDKSPQKTTVTDETITEDGNGIDGETFRTLGVNHILTTGEKLNPLIKNAKTITFTWEKQPADAVDVSVSKDDGKTPAKDVWLWNDGNGNYYISSGVTDAVINFNAMSNGMFMGCDQLTQINFDNINTSQMRNAQDMFNGCTSLTSLDVSSFNFAALLYADRMYYNCSGVQTIYSAGIKKIGDAEEVKMIPVSIVAKPLNTFCVADEKITNEDGTETANTNEQFTADDFTFEVHYIRSDGLAPEGIDDEVQVTKDDIESFNKTGPWSKSDKKVTITFKPTSKYYSIARTVTANIQVDGPEDYDGTIEIDEHPIVTTAVEETRQSLTIDLLKIDSETKQPISGALIGLYAANDILDVDGNVLFEKDQLIQSMESDEAEDSHAVEFSNLPSDAYIKNRGENMYYVKEISAPAGYKITDPDKCYYFKGSLGDDKVHCEILHTWAGDEMAADGDNDSTHYIMDSGKMENTPGGLGFMKIWDDHGNAAGKRPDKVTVSIYDSTLGKNAPPMETLTLTAENNWSATSDVLNQSTIKGMSDAEFKDRYTVTESYVDGYNHDQTKNAVLTKMNSRYVYKLDNVGDNDTYAEIQKVWNDQDDAEHKRPSEIKVQLYRDGVAYGEPVVLNEENQWRYTTRRGDSINNPQKLLAYNEKTGAKYKYTWKEQLTDVITDDPNTGYTISYATDEDAYLTTVTNTLQNGIMVVKDWDDNDNEADLRVDSVEVQLYRNGESMGEKYKYTLSDENDWQKYIPDVPVNDPDGNPYEYTWKEISKNWTVTDENASQVGYMPSYEEATMDGLPTTIITNKVYTRGSIKVYKDLDPDDVYFSHGNPKFTFHVKGKNWKGEDVDLTKTVEFTEEDLQKFKQEDHKDGDKIRKEAVFENVELGSYTVTESGTEGMYELDKIDTSGNNVTVSDDKKSAVVVIGKDKDGEIYSTGTVGFYNVSYKGSIKVIKYSDDAKEKPLKGVTFALYDNKGDKVAEKETDENGEVLFDKLHRATYILKETKTLPGYSLLKDSISITIPKTLTTAEAKAQKADLSKGKYNEADDTYDFYDLVYKVTDHAIPGVPMTGAFDNWQTYVPIVIAMGLLIGVGIYEIKKKKSPKTENEEK